MSSLSHLIFGNLTIQAVPFTNPLIMGAGAFMAVIAIVILGLITYFKKWKYLWTEWLTTVDHKKVGIMYFILAFIALLRGFFDALMMRIQQAISSGSNYGYLPPEHYDQIFTAHGVIMIFFAATGFIFGFVNYIIPKQIGARDVAFPFLNSLSFWLAAGGFALVLISLVVGDFAATGWLAYPPLSELKYSPTVGVDYYLWALTLSGIGSLIGGINIIVTIFKMRCPGMSWMKMPLFTWSVLCSMIMVALAFPVINITFFMLFLDRFLDMHFFTLANGGNPMLYINLVWVWGHPEVYILVLPAFGIYSEIVSTFSRKGLFGYAAMVWATFIITILSVCVWVHHFFTMGNGANVNSVFGIATMIIAVPTGVKIFNWIATMYKGKVTMSVPMLWVIGFFIIFLIGGMTGVMQAMPGIDFLLHNTVFLVAHFHSTIIGGVVFALFAGFNYWFPKMFGFKLDERFGKLSFWFWFIGFLFAFIPLYILGLMGMPRRMYHYDAASGYQPFLIIAAIGAFLILLGVICTVIQLIVSIKNRKQLKTDDPWDARTLEWSTHSPAPFYNFAFIPVVNHRDDFWEKKQMGLKYEKPDHYEDIHMPKSTSIGFLIGIMGAAFGFAMVWQMYLFAIISGITILITLIVRVCDFNRDYYVTASEVEKIEKSYDK